MVVCVSNHGVGSHDEGFEFGSVSGFDAENEDIRNWCYQGFVASRYHGDAGKIWMKGETRPNSRFSPRKRPGLITCRPSMRRRRLRRGEDIMETAQRGSTKMLRAFDQPLPNVNTTAMSSINFMMPELPNLSADNHSSVRISACICGWIESIFLHDMCRNFIA